MTQSNSTSKVVAISGPTHTFDREIPKDISYMVDASIVQLGGLRQCHFGGSVKYQAMENESGSHDHINRIGVVAYLPTASELATLPLNPKTIVAVQFSETRPMFDNYRLQEYLTPKIRRLLRRMINVENMRSCIPFLPGTDSENEVEVGSDSKSKVNDSEKLIVYSSGTVLPAILHGVNIGAVVNSFVPHEDITVENGPVLLELLDCHYREMVSRLYYRNTPFASANGHKCGNAFAGLLMIILIGYRSNFPGIEYSDDLTKYVDNVVEVLVEHAKTTVVPASVEDANIRNALVSLVAEMSKAKIAVE